MRTVIGVVLIVAGVSIGAYASSPEKGNDARASLSRSLTNASTPLAASIATADGTATIAEASQPPPVATTAHEVKVISIAKAPPRVPVDLHTPSSRLYRDDRTLTRKVQLQLRRVGCYWGDINGIWSASTSRSMKAFTDHVNAVLPIGHPDIALLALLENHRDGACGVQRPVGQAVAHDGHRLPAAPNGTSFAGGTSNAAKNVSKATRVDRNKISVARVRERWSQQAPKDDYRQATWAARAFLVIH